MIRTSRLTESEVVALYAGGEKVNRIAELAGLTRQAIHNMLKRCGCHEPLRGSIITECRLCGQSFRAYKKRLNKKNSGYCSVQCFHASRSRWGRLSKPVALQTDIEQRAARTATKRFLEQHGIFLSRGQVAHHINGDNNDNRLDNIKIYDSHGEHMAAHHNRME